MKKEKKQTFTYSCRPSIRNKAMKKAVRAGATLSEVIDALLENYGEMPAHNPAKKRTVLQFGGEQYELK